MYDLRESVRRDLEALLNCRQRFLSSPDILVETQSSIINYVIPDLSSINFNDRKSKESFAKKLEHIIRFYEPRFKSVRVHTYPDNKQDGKLRFKVDAILYADPSPEAVVFDSQFEPITKMVSVSEKKS